MTTKQPSAGRGALQPARAVKQRRSQDTLERILTAAEQLLDEHDFDELTMVEVARHAGCAVGTVYGRIPNKQSLLVCLHERYMAAGNARSAALAEHGGSLAERVRELTTLIVDFFTEWSGVSRAITLHLYGRSGKGAQAFRREATAAFKQAAGFLAEKVEARLHPSPQAACEFGLLTAVDVAQGRVVFGERSGLRLRFSRRDLKERIAAMLLAYLRCPDDRRSR